MEQWSSIGSSAATRSRRGHLRDAERAAGVLYYKRSKSLHGDSPIKTANQPKQGVFISYARRDGEEFAHALHARLLKEAPDIPAWLDRLELEGGIGWWNQIERELDRAEFLIVVMTPAAMLSENTRREWRSARQRGVCVYPVIGTPDAALDFDSLPNWMRKSHFYHPVIEWDKMLAHLRRGCRATRVPYMAPPLPQSFVPRSSETQAVLQHLLGDGQSAKSVTVALRGPGGFGKTTLAAAVCHDDGCIDSFDDGILWVTLGQTPNLLNELVKLYAALTGERPGFVDVEDAARELALRLDGKNCLIVIDDAWSIGHVRPFLRGGTGCSRLITTRRFEVTLDTLRVDIDEMTPSQSFELLMARSGAMNTDGESIKGLTARLGHWPLPITLAGAALRQRLERGDPLPRALAYVSRALEKRGITAFDLEQTSSREDAVARTIGASLDLLTQEQQLRCAELTAFRADEPIPIDAANKLWGLDDIDGEDLAHKLDELALIEFDLRIATLRIHDELRAFLQKRLHDLASVHERLISAWGDPYQLPDGYAWRSFAYHLKHAGRGDLLRALLLEPKWLKAKLAGAGILSLITDFDGLGSDHVLALVRDALRLSAPSLAADPTQFDTQIAGRLLAIQESEILQLRRAIEQQGRQPRLCLLHPTLDAPGGILNMTLYGHGNAVNSLAVSSNHRTLASTSEDGTVRIWDTENGHLSTVLYDKRSVLGMRAAAIDSNGRFVIAGGANGMLYVWDIPQGKLSHCARDWSRAITSIALSADGRIAVCASREAELRIWDVRKQTPMNTLTGHRDSVNAVALSESGNRAVSASEDLTLRVWDVPNASQEGTLAGHSGPVNSIALSADGRFALSASSDRTVRLWDVDEKKCTRILTEHAASVICAALSPDGTYGASADSDRKVNVWNLRDGSIVARLQGHSDVVRAMVISNGGLRVVTGSGDSTIKLWNLEAIRAPDAPQPHSRPVECLVFSPDGQLLASGGDDGRVNVFDIASGRVIQSLDAHSAPTRSIAFSTDSSCLLTGGLDGKFWFWIIETGNRTWLSVSHGAPVLCFAQSRVTHYLASACSDRFVYIWDMPSCSRIQRYGTRRLFDHLIAASPHRKDLAANDEVADTYLPGETLFNIHAATMSPDGRLAIFSATSVERTGGEILVDRVNREAPGAPRGIAVLLSLDLQTGAIDSIEVSQAGPITAFAVDASGARILLAKQDHSLELWDLRNEERICMLCGHTNTVIAVVFSSDGQYAFSCGRDRTLRAWDLGRHSTAAIFTADAALHSLAVSPSSNTIATGDTAGRVHILRLVNG